MDDITQKLNEAEVLMHENTCLLELMEGYCVYAMENEGSITIALEENRTLCIKDTGIGIAPEDLPRVFEKSYTGYNGRADKKASGIGLYLCKRICDALGHKISISSSESG